MDVADRDNQISELKGDLEATIEAKDSLEAELKGEIEDRDGQISNLEENLTSLGKAKDDLEAELRGEISDREGKIMLMEDASKGRRTNLSSMSGEGVPGGSVTVLEDGPMRSEWPLRSTATSSTR